MFNSKNKKYFLIIVILYIIDKITKQLVLTSGKTVNLWILDISEVHNTGASFGILKGSNLILALVSIAVLITIMFYFKKIEDENKIPASMITAGILGNLTDRIIYYHVIDFIDFRWWPVFNFADCCIVIGVIWIGINTFKENKSNINSISSRNSMKLKKKHRRI